MMLWSKVSLLMDWWIGGLVDWCLVLGGLVLGDFFKPLH
jgi:hypothetical protein